MSSSVDTIAGVNLADLKRVTDLFGPIKKQGFNCVLINQVHMYIYIYVLACFRQRTGMLNCLFLSL